MEIHGPRNPGRPEANRTGEAQGAPRRSLRKGGAGGIVDRLEPGDSVLIDQAVEKVMRQLDRGSSDIRARREELLQRANDPEAIHRAARALLRGGVVTPEDLA